MFTMLLKTDNFQLYNKVHPLFTSNFRFSKASHLFVFYFLWSFFDRLSLFFPCFNTLSKYGTFQQNIIPLRQCLLWSAQWVRRPAPDSTPFCMASLKGLLAPRLPAPPPEAFPALPAFAGIAILPVRVAGLIIEPGWALEGKVAV